MSKIFPKIYFKLYSNVTTHNQTYDLKKIKNNNNNKLINMFIYSITIHFILNNKDYYSCCYPYSGYQMCPTHINSYTEIGHKILVPQVIHEIDPMPSIFLFQYQISSNTDEFI